MPEHYNNPLLLVGQTFECHVEAAPELSRTINPVPQLSHYNPHLPNPHVARFTNL